MPDHISRRKVLETTAASGIAVSAAGCSGILGSSSACDAGDGFVQAIFDNDAEEAASYYPHEYMDDYDEDDAIAELQMISALGGGGELEEVSCECSESVDEKDLEATNEDERFDAEVEEGAELRYDVTAEVDGEGESEAVYAAGVKIDSDWYVVLSDEEAMEQCS